MEAVNGNLFPSQSWDAQVQVFSRKGEVLDTASLPFINMRFSRDDGTGATSYGTSSSITSGIPGTTGLATSTDSTGTAGQTSTGVYLTGTSGVDSNTSVTASSSSTILVTNGFDLTLKAGSTGVRMYAGMALALLASVACILF